MSKPKARMYKVRITRHGAKPMIVRLNTEAEARQWATRPGVKYVGPVTIAPSADGAKEIKRR